MHTKPPSWRCLGIAAHPLDKFPQFWLMQFDQTVVPKAAADKFRTNIAQTLSIRLAE